MTAFVSIQLDDEQQARLEALAAERKETPDVVATRAVVDLLEYEDRFRAAVEAGLSSLDRGLGSDLAEVAEDVRAYMDARGRPDDQTR